jgi:hypothetical protein
MKDLTPYFLAATKDCKELEEAIDIIKKNSSGRIWLIGGFVYRNIASQIYGIPRPEVDLDFVVEIPAETFNLPSGWTIETNRFGNPKFVNGNKKIDYVPINTLYSIKYRELEPSIENYLSGTPLTIQSIVYDIYKSKIIVGEKFMGALTHKVVEVQNLYLAEYSAQQKETTLKKMIRKKANSLQFRAVFPY